MIKSLLKFSINFVIIFLILSTPIKDKTLFNHIEKITTPFLGSFYKNIGEGMNETIHKGKRIGKKLFSNANPNIESQDQIKKSSSAILKNDIYYEDYSGEDIDQLKKQFNDHQ